LSHSLPARDFLSKYKIVCGVIMIAIHMDIIVIVIAMAVHLASIVTVIGIALALC